MKRRRSRPLGESTNPFPLVEDATSEGWERFFWLVFNRSLVPMVLLDENRVRIAVNRASCDYFGRPAIQAIGRRVDMDVTPQSLRRLEGDWQRLLRKRDFTVNVGIRRADGAVLHSEFAARAATIDGRPLVLAVLLGAEPEMDVDSDKAGELTPRERAVVHLLTLGLTSAEIARRLRISEQTVRTHVRNAMARTGTRTRAQLVAAALAERRTYRSEGRIA